MVFRIISRMHAVVLGGLFLVSSAFGWAQDVTLSPTSLSWNTVQVGQTSSIKSTTLTNNQSVPLAISGIVLPLGSDFSESTTTCPVGSGTLAAGSSCSIGVAFRPLAQGARGSQLSIMDNAPSGSQQLALSGNGVTGPVLFSPTSVSFGSTAPGSVSAAQTVTLANTLSTDITLAGIKISSQFAQTNNCPLSPNTLPAGTSCSFSVTFAPTGSGNPSGTVSVSYTSGSTASAQQLYLSGSTPANYVTLTPSSYDFGNQAVNAASAAKNFTLTNTFGSPITIASIATKLADYSVSSTCPASPNTLASNATCTVSVTFQPTTTGAREDTLTVTHNAPGSPTTAALSGTGTSSAPLGGVTFTPTTYNFGTVAPGSSSAANTFTLSNTQQTALSISSISSSSSDFTATNTCGTSLASGASCTVSVKFAPATAGSKSATLSVVSNDTGSPHTAALSGTAGTASNGVTLSPKQYNFGNQTVGATATSTPITLSNGQSTALSISSIQIAAPFAQTNNCGASLAAGASCSITLTYSPAAAGYNSATLSVSDNASGSPQTVPVTGNAVVAVGISPKIPVYFSNQLVNHTSTPQAVTVTNNQSTTLNISSIATTASFPVTGNCVGAVAPGASCTINVAFDPQAATSYQSSLTINDDAPGSPQTVAVQGTGIANTVVVNVGPYKPCVLPSSTTQYTATVVNSTNTAVKWYVDSTYGGSSGGGTITQGGLYTAPATTGSHTIRAVSQAVPSASGTSPTTITSTPAVNIYPYTASILPSGQQTFQAQICGVPQTGSLTYTVDGIAGGNATVGTVTSDGVYTAPGKPGKHSIKVTDAAANNGSSTAVATVYSNIAVDFGSRTNTTYPVPADAFGSGRVETLQTQSDMALIKAAGITVSRTYAQIPTTYATQTPNWKLIDGYISNLQTAGIKPILQIAFTPAWLQPNPNPCGAGNYSVPPTDLNAWAQIAAAYVAHMDAKFPGFVQDYEIWNEPDAGSLCTSKNHLQTYISIYAAAAPVMKQQAAADGVSIRIGGPALASATATNWITTLLSTSTTAPYVDFVSYHQYLFGQQNLNVSWDNYTGYSSVYQRTQDPALGAVAYYSKVAAWVKAGQQPLGAKTPIYIDEFNTNWAFFADCCRNDAVYAPVWNALYISDLLNSVYSGTPAVPNKLVYFATNAYPYFCLLGTQDANMDCQYSIGATGQTYPQYYTYQLLAAPSYLGLQSGGYLAASVTPPAGGGGLVVTAFYNPSQDAILITNPTGTDFSQVQVSLQNTGYTAPQATLYGIVNGSSITSSSLSLSPQGANFTANIAVPRYSVQAISLKGQ